jgi:hypothetical protein
MQLAPQIARDEKIQTAVSSTQQIRSLTNSQKKLYDTHPELYPTSMRWMDNQPVSQYLNSTDLNQGYQGPSDATRYTDYHKGIEDMVKQIVPDIKMEINADGKYQWKTEKYSTVTNDRIQATVAGYLASNPEATKSLRADALYTYKDASPEFMYNHLNDVYDKNIAQLKSINSNYELEIHQNPMDRDFTADRKQAMVANAKAITDMYNKKATFGQYLQDPSKFDDVKQTVFTDNLKGMFSTVYQKDDIDRKIEENFNAKNADDFAIKRAAQQTEAAKVNSQIQKDKDEQIHNGFEPVPDKYGNPIKLTPESKYWSVYQDFLKSKGSKKKGDGSDDDENQFDGVPEVVGKNPIAKYSNTDLLNTQMKTLQTSIDDTKDKFFQNWKSTSGLPDAAQKPAFDKFLQKQEDLWLQGDIDHVTPAFREYKSRTQDNEIDLGVYDTLKDKALEQATKLNPVPNKTFTLKPGDVEVRNNAALGTRQAYIDAHTLTYNPATDKDLYAAVNKIADNVGDSQDRGKIAAAIDQYKGTKIYDKLRLINSYSNLNFKGARDAMMQPLNQTKDARDEATNEYLKANEKDYAPQQYAPSGKRSDQSYQNAQDRVLTLLQENQGVGERDRYDLSDKEVNAANIEVYGATVTPDGYYRYNYKIPGHKPDFIRSTNPASPADKILPIDPDDRLKKAIHVMGSTPTSGPNVFTTKDAKIRYAVKESTYDKNMYDVSIIDKGTLVPLVTTTNDGDIFHSMSPSQIQKTLEQYSRMPSRVNPKVPMSREEVYDKLTLPTDKYEAKYPAPPNK